MWVLYATIAYTLFAAATLTDKYLLSRPLPDPKVYAFYTGVFGIAAFVFAPFGFSIPSASFIFFALLAGAIFIGALYLLFSALKIGEASRVGVSLGGLIPIFTFLFIYVTTGELPSTAQAAALTLLVAGSIIIVLERISKLFGNIQKFGLVLGSSFLFGLYYVLVKFLFASESFISTFLWIKIGGAIFALSFLFSRQVRGTLLEHKKSPPKQVAGIFVLKNAAGGIGALSLHFAVSIVRFGEVAIVNALQGIQLVFIFLAALFLTKKFPRLIKEEIHKRALVTKFIGTGLVVAGIAVLALTS